MRKLSVLTSSVTSLVALAAIGCSSPAEGGGGNFIGMFGMPGQGGAANNGGGVINGSNTNGGQGSGVIGGGGTEGQVIGGLNPGGGGANTGTVGAGGAGAVVDVINEPGPGFFVTGALKGYAWTARESDPVTGATTITPPDFTTHVANTPFCLQGTVAADPPSSPTATDGYQSFAMLGFNVNQAGVPEVPGAEPVVGTAVPTGTGLAFSFQQPVASLLRVQLQGLDPTNPTQRWCAAVPLPDAEGRAFIRYDAFHQTCYDPLTLTPPGNPGFYARPGVTPAPIAAISFQVPGDIVPVPYNFCINGFTDGTAAADVEPFGGGGLISGTLSTNFGRAKVRGTDGRSYVVQNNAWNQGVQPGSHRVSFVGNSFTVAQQSSGGFGSIPISFPSVFVGRNGDQGVGGTFTTTEDDGLPVAINQIGSINTVLRHNGGNGPQGEYNVTYDIWFANTPPAGAYDDAQAAFLMVWLYKPGGKNPIGLSPSVNGITVPGAPGTWDIWVGPRGENGAEDNLNDNAPVISYVATSTIPNFQANLKAFFDDAVARSGSAGFKGFTFANNLVLTDIFGGAEIWSGGTNLSVSEFTVDVQ